MKTRDILLAIQYISILGVFIESCVIFRKMKTPLHSYLFFSCVAALAANIGYLLELMSTTEDAYFTALQFAYAGRVWYAYALFMFISELCRIKVPTLPRITLMIAHALVYVEIILIRKNDLYYTNTKFIVYGMFPKLFHGNGPVHTFFMSLQIIYIVLGLVWLFKTYVGEKRPIAKRRLMTVFLGVAVQSIFFVSELLGKNPVTFSFDATTFGYFFGMIFMMIAVFSYDLLGTRELAKDFVIDRLTEGIIAVDNSGVIKYINEPAKEIYPEITGTLENLPPEITHAMETKETITIGDRIYSPEVNELIDDGKNVGKIYAIVDDTEHFRYMDELQKQRDIADQANEAKSRFLANMSHEIRTPINAVLGMDEMILRESTEKTIRTYAADIMSAGRTLLSLINDILDLSKVEEGKMEIIPAQYEMAALVGDLSNMIRGRAEKKGIKYELDIDTEIPRLLYGDEIRIRQCVLNLLTNGVKYTEKGSVTLGARYEKKDDSHIMLKFTITDTGIGMKKADMERLLEPYQRIEEKRNRSIEGTGLGMSIVSGLLELMGSELQIKSEYGVGTTASFEVEQKVLSWERTGDIIDFSNVAESYTYRELFVAPDAHILVVDDTEMNITVMESLLKKTGVKIDSAVSGREALKLTAQNKYDVIFIDHMMPDMDGMETLNHMRETGLNPDTPAIALTANAVAGARKRYLDAGFSDYLSKPVDSERLERMLKSFIPDEKLLPAGTAFEEADKESPEARSTEGRGANLSEDRTANDLPGWVSKLPGVDVEAGIKNCGSTEGYLSVITVFCQTIPVKSREIEELYKKNDVENYTIKVHALKSSARIIGAAELSALAESLENAGKNRDMDFINKNTNRLLEMYKELMVAMEAPEDNSDLPEADPAMIREAYQTICEIAGSMEYGLLEDMLKDLKGYRMPPADRENMNRIEGLLNALDWDGICELAKNANSAGGTKAS